MKKPELKLIKTSELEELEELHDRIVNSLDFPEKAGINTLLDKNNKIFQRLLYKYLDSSCCNDVSDLMVALDNLLTVHTRECYTIGYLDCLAVHRRGNLTKGKMS